MEYMFNSDAILPLDTDDEGYSKSDSSDDDLDETASWLWGMTRLQRCSPAGSKRT